MESLKRLIGEHPFFQGMEDDQLALLTGCATNTRFDPGAFLIRAGREAEFVYLIRHGRVALEISAPGREPIVIQTLSEGEVLGWSWLIPPYIAMYDAVALEPTVAIAMDGTCIRTKCDTDHDLGYEVYRRFSHLMSSRLQSTRLQLLDVYAAPRR